MEAFGSILWEYRKFFACNYVDNGETAAPTIMRILSEASIQINSLSVSKPTLDDVFLKYTGRTMRAEEGKITTFSQMRQRQNRRMAK